MTIKFNSKILIEDLKYIHSNNDNKNFFKNKNILITGYQGFIGYEFTNYFIKYFKELKLKKLILIDIKKKIFLNKSNIICIQKDIAKMNLKKEFKSTKIDIIIHAASIASPVFYRIYPIETLESNIFGLNNILKFAKKYKVSRILYFSSSEIYGNPDKNNIPTKESYNGNVSSVGPRSCYDEAKRICETMCYVYNTKYKVPVRIVRPFNNYGPGLSINDKRLPADLAKNILTNSDLTLYSDGKPTRSFCYISDAVVGYLKVLKYKKFGIFNIGNDMEEISIKKFSDIFLNLAKKNFKFSKSIKFTKNRDKDYLTNNPDRRCPDLSFARKELKFAPKINTKVGVYRYLKYLYEKN